MKKYTNGKREIYASKKAFEVIYKEQGFKEVVKDVKLTESKNTTTTGKRGKSK